MIFSPWRMTGSGRFLDSPHPMDYYRMAFI